MSSPALVDNHMEKREHIISFRLNGEEAGHIDTASTGSRRKPGDWCRAVVLEKSNQAVPTPVKPRRCPARKLPTFDIQELARISGHLGKIGSNVNQLARVANTVGKIPETAILKIIHGEITIAKDTIKHTLEGGAS